MKLSQIISEAMSEVYNHISFSRLKNIEDQISIRNGKFATRLSWIQSEILHRKQPVEKETFFKKYEPSFKGICFTVGGSKK